MIKYDSLQIIVMKLSEIIRRVSVSVRASEEFTHHFVFSIKLNVKIFPPSQKHFVMNTDLVNCNV